MERDGRKMKTRDNSRIRLTSRERLITTRSQISQRRQRLETSRLVFGAVAQARVWLIRLLTFNLFN